MRIGITVGDASGVGPEILLKAWSGGQLKPPIVVFGDLDILEYCNDRLGYGVSFHKAQGPTDIRQGSLNVLDHGLLRREDLTIGQVDAASGRVAREYVVAAAQAALAGEIYAMVTLPIGQTVDIFGI